MKNRFTKYERELRNACKGTAKAIEALDCEWCADCDMRKIEKLILRCAGWEFRMKKLVGKYE